MIRRSLLIALSAAALSLVGGQAQANFSITTNVTAANPGNAPFTFNANTLGTTGPGAPTPTPTGGVSFNFLDIVYPGSTFTGMGSITLTGTFNVNNNGVSGMGSFMATLSYNLTAGYGNLSVTTLSITNAAGTGVTFTPITFTAPTISDGNMSTGNLSTTVTAVAPTAVPEPASLAMLGLGLAGVGCVARRRRAA